MREQVAVKVEICREGVILPKYARMGDAGCDVCAAEDVLVGSGRTVVIPTGLKTAVPDGYEIQVRPRSGLSLNTPLRVANTPGTIDSLYRDEIGVIIHNSSPNPEASDVYGGSKRFPPVHLINEKGNLIGDYLIKKGDKIAQLVLNEVPQIVFEPVDDIATIEGNRGGGFGHTGV
jgi:dUTP pyrophosphatase